MSATLESLNSILDKVGAVLPWVKHWLNRPIIVPHQRAHWWHMGRTGGQKPAMQIVSHWYVTNRTDRPVSILRAYIKAPRTVGHVLVKDAYSNFHGSYAVPAHTTTELGADFWIAPPIRKEGKDFKAHVVFVDQYGQKRTIRNVEFKSDKKKRPSPVRLTEEAVYKLEHKIEKKVAAVLKDEINRYRKYGRQSGQLGSIGAFGFIMSCGVLVGAAWRWPGSRTGSAGSGRCEMNRKHMLGAALGLVHHLFHVTPFPTD